jgi:antitoxin component of MazEF toxin-antitoxin module
MTQLTIVNFGEAAAVVLPASVMETVGLRIGDVLEATLSERQLTLRPVDDAARRKMFEDAAKDVFEQRRDAFQRLA